MFAVTGTQISKSTMRIVTRSPIRRNFRKRCRGFKGLEVIGGSGRNSETIWHVIEFSQYGHDSKEAENRTNSKGLQVQIGY
ncbi:unnamed protein product [Caenorhabditis angaria]|uniref:Uncharacterized protein n=1 Tax=Caenorhabditis angaria TaxID=860376 RepID=A0A9P1N1T1_9PELO|nr:unnamed protein product [Caenorhabditis angaria]